MNKQMENADDFLSIFDQPEEQLEYVHGFRVTREDLEALAEHYLDVIWDVDYWDRFYRQYGGTWERRRDASHRLNVIAETLGDRTFEEIERGVDEKWKRSFKDYSKGPLVCNACGVPQETLWGIDDQMCLECRDADGPQAEEHEESTSLTGSLGRD